jgi:hypothetical protein
MTSPTHLTRDGIDDAGLEWTQSKQFLDTDGNGLNIPPGFRYICRRLWSDYYRHVGLCPVIVKKDPTLPRSRPLGSQSPQSSLKNPSYTFHPHQTRRSGHACR